jgi:hypothetical protein
MQLDGRRMNADLSRRLVAMTILAALWPAIRSAPGACKPRGESSTRSGARLGARTSNNMLSSSTASSTRRRNSQTFPASRPRFARPRRCADRPCGRSFSPVVATTNSNLERSSATRPHEPRPCSHWLAKWSRSTASRAPSRATTTSGATRSALAKIVIRTDRGRASQRDWPPCQHRPATRPQRRSPCQAAISCRSSSLASSVGSRWGLCARPAASDLESFSSTWRYTNTWHPASRSAGSALRGGWRPDASAAPPPPARPWTLVKPRTVRSWAHCSNSLTHRRWVRMVREASRRTSRTASYRARSFTPSRRASQALRGPCARTIQRIPLAVWRWTCPGRLVASRHSSQKITSAATLTTP